MRYKPKPFEEHTLADVLLLIAWAMTRNRVLQGEIDENVSNIKKWKKRVKEIKKAKHENMCEYPKCPNKRVCLYYCRKHHQQVCK